MGAQFTAQSYLPPMQQCSRAGVVSAASSGEVLAILLAQVHSAGPIHPSPAPSLGPIQTHLLQLSDSDTGGPQSTNCSFLPLRVFILRS